MHRFHIADGQVTYRSRFLRSDSYKQNSEMNRIVVSEFGTLAFPDPCKNIFQRFLSHFERMSEYSLLTNAKICTCCNSVKLIAGQGLVSLDRQDRITSNSLDWTDWIAYCYASCSLGITMKCWNDLGLEYALIRFQSRLGTDRSFHIWVSHLVSGVRQTLTFPPPPWSHSTWEVGYPGELSEMFLEFTGWLSWFLA